MATEQTNTTKSINAAFTVNAPCTAASVTTQPANQSITYGADATFTATGSGSPAPTVQWQVSVNAGAFTNISGATSTTLTLTKPGVAASGNKYHAVFTNTCNGTKTSTTSDVSLTVAAKSVSGNFSASNKTYDGSTSATISGRSLSGAIPGDDASLSGGNATFDTKNVGSGKTVTGTGFGLSGTAAGNYSLAATTLTTTADITAKAVTGAFTASNKQYDGTTAASIISRSITGGVVGTETVTLTGGTATFGTKDVGTGKTVTGTGFTLGGGDASNYTLGSVPTATADITAKSLSGSFTANNKEYDGNRNATVASKSLPGVVSGETVTLNVSNPLFDTKDVGTNKDVTGVSASAARTPVTTRSTAHTRPRPTSRRRDCPGRLRRTTRSTTVTAMRRWRRSRCRVWSAARP